MADAATVEDEIAAAVRRTSTAPASASAPGQGAAWAPDAEIEAAVKRTSGNSALENLISPQGQAAPGPMDPAGPEIFDALGIGSLVGPPVKAAWDVIHKPLAFPASIARDIGTSTMHGLDSLLATDLPSDVPLPQREQMNRNAAQDFPLLSLAGTEPHGTGNLIPGLHPGDVANTLSRVPGFLADFGGEQAGALIEQAPEQMALGAAGDAMKAGEVFPAIRDAVGEHLPFLTHRGGFEPGALADFEAYDRAKLAGINKATDLGHSLALDATGALRTPEQQQTIGFLMEQPAVRDMLAKMNEEPVDIAALSERMVPRVRSVPGKPETYGVENLGHNIPPEIQPERLDAMPIKDYAQHAQEAALAFGSTKQRMIELGIKDPDFFARFQELNYNPIVYADKKLAMAPGLNNLKAAGIKEEAKFLSYRSDKTKEAREMLGMLDPGPAVAIRLAQEEQLIATRELFTRVAANPNVTLANAADLKATDQLIKSAIGNKFTYLGRTYEELPPDKVYGPLAGQMVTAPEAAEIKAMARIYGNPTYYDVMKAYWAAWKFGKTVLSPKTQIANTLGNLQLAHMAGLSPTRVDVYASAFNDVRAGTSAMWKEARAAGAPWAASQGLGLDDIMDPNLLTDSLRKGDRGMIENALLALPKFMMKNEMGSAQLARVYQANEAWFKQALYRYGRMEQGMAPGAAVQFADRAIINYDKLPMWVKQLRTMPGAVPFVSFTYGAAPLATQALLERPQVFYQWKLAVDSFNHVLREAHQVSDQEWNAKKAQWDALNPGTVPVFGGRDARQTMLFYDVARYSAVQDYIPGRAGGLEGPWSVALKSPVLQEIMTQANGIDPVSHAKVFNKVDSEAQLRQNMAGLGEKPAAIEQAVKTSAPGREEMSRARWLHAARTFLPEILGGGTSQNIWNAMHGDTSIFHDPISTQRALAEVVTGHGRTIQDSLLQAARGVDASIQGGAKGMVTRAERKAAEKRVSR